MILCIYQSCVCIQLYSMMNSLRHKCNGADDVLGNRTPNSGSPVHGGGQNDRFASAAAQHQQSVQRHLSSQAAEGEYESSSEEEELNDDDIIAKMMTTFQGPNSG